MSTQKSEIIVLNFRPDNRAKDYKALGVLAQELKGRPITEGNEHLGTCCLEIMRFDTGIFFNRIFLIIWITVRVIYTPLYPTFI